MVARPGFRSFVLATLGAIALAGPGCGPLASLLPGLTTGVLPGGSDGIPDGFKGTLSVNLTGATQGVFIPTNSGWGEPAWAYAFKDGRYSASMGAAADSGQGTQTYALAIIAMGELAKKTYKIVKSTASPADGEATVAISATSTDGKSTAIVATSGTLSIDGVDGPLAKFADRAVVTFSLKDAKCEVVTSTGGAAATGSVTLSLEGKASAARI